MTLLRYIERGVGRPIVWIHGFPLSSIIFEQQLEIPGVRHVVPDLQGFGDSAPSDVKTIDDYASAVLSTLDSLSIDQAVFAGVSMGGYVTFSVVRHAPERVSGWILIDTRETPDSAEATKNRRRQSERVDREGTGFLVDELLPRMLTTSTLRAGDQRAEIVRRAMSSASPAGVRDALGAMADRPDSAEVIREYPGPILVAVGDEDDITPPSDAERMASFGTNTTLVRIRGAAHLSHVECPREFNAAVTAFLGCVR